MEECRVAKTRVIQIQREGKYRAEIRDEVSRLQTPVNGGSRSELHIDVDPAEADDGVEVYQSIETCHNHTAAGGNRKSHCAIGEVCKANLKRQAYRNGSNSKYVASCCDSCLKMRSELSHKIKLTNTSEGLSPWRQQLGLLLRREP